jgi:hypothetical protein
MTDIAINPTDTLHLVALDRPQLEAAHAKMIAWAKARIEKVDVDLQVEEGARDAAIEHKFVAAPFDRRIKALVRSRTFYEKILAAVEAGFVIVPNFAMNVFAIRTKAAKPRSTTSTWNHERFQQSAQQLPQGEGEYRNPLPVVYQRPETRDDGKGGTKSVMVYNPEEFRDDVEFPIALARPELMSRTGQAMALKLFDEIGVAVDSGSRVGGGRGDPIVIGRLLNPRPNAPALSFFIGWYFDPSRL